MTVAVTGPFASGKSTFVRMLGELGAETVSADEIVHRLLASDPETIARVAERFGGEVLGERGVDRRRLGERVFGDEGALRELEGILHPLVRREIGRRVSASRAPVFVAEIPLLFEGGDRYDFDCTVAVLTPEERRRGWASERGVGEERFQAIEGRQLSAEEKARLADVVVENDGGPDRLREQARALWERLLAERGSGGS
ncbi:dephospho-CoA kinase [Rubrobacter xylanophilus]|uniref:Dephospho-CoA kinase n=1 Tax=Rubrobacter xylanophilus TaxID=49319 RepID=A0A510HHN1_9ACTN|nr:dephospho-CoA kinase [Rubrobacter xylanophilus]BBL79418.1 dephospho-CoA kinase [Rubrobacter xylanophilus]